MTLMFEIKDQESTMRTEIRKANAIAEIETQERCHILEVANDSGDESVSIARARIEVGVTTFLHCLRGVSERYVIVAGVGRVELADLDPVEVCAGDVVRIPPDTPQRITNIGVSDLVFYCVCTPPFNPIYYKPLE
jgi:mannose-6-phosphate isomerase-like protein (cupin superfamily)